MAEDCLLSFKFRSDEDLRNDEIVAKQAEDIVDHIFFGPTDACRMSDTADGWKIEEGETGIAGAADTFDIDYADSFDFVM